VVFLVGICVIEEEEQDTMIVLGLVLGTEVQVFGLAFDSGT